MKCPYCGDAGTQVVDTRENEDGDTVRRRRRCPACDKRFTTYERVELQLPMVVKKNASRADYDRDKGTITLVIQAVGKTTREMQRDLKAGDRLVALVGPMGIPSHIGKAKKVLCVGGGLGVAPVFPQARAYKESGAYVIGVLGFRNRGLMFWEDKFRAFCDELIVCTDDGSAGVKGMVT